MIKTVEYYGKMVILNLLVLYSGLTMVHILIVLYIYIYIYIYTYIYIYMYVNNKVDFVCRYHSR